MFWASKYEKELEGSASERFKHITCDIESWDDRIINEDWISTEQARYPRAYQL